jgi:hypothetical protein
MSDGERRFGRTAFYIAGGLLLWIANFTFVYAFAAVACARGFATQRVLGIGIVLFVTMLMSIIAAVATVWLLVRALRSTTTEEHAQFLRFVACATCILALIALAWLALPVLTVAACTR